MTVQLTLDDWYQLTEFLANAGMSRRSATFTSIVAQVERGANVPQQLAFPPPPSSEKVRRGGRRSSSRVDEMYAMYQQGNTLEDVGRRYGITRERVRQLFKKAELPTRGRKGAGELTNARHVQNQEQRVEKAGDLFKEHGDVSVVAKRLKVSEQVARRLIRKALGDDIRTVTVKKKAPKRYTDDELIECLRVASRELGGVLSTAAFTQFGRQQKKLKGRRPWPSPQTIMLRFGSWRDALAVAGLRANAPSPIKGQRIFEDAHCMDAIRELARVSNKRPTANEYDEYARKLGGAIPSLATIRNRCGSWSEALQRALS